MNYVFGFFLIIVIPGSFLHVYVKLYILVILILALLCIGKLNAWKSLFCVTFCCPLPKIHLKPCLYSLPVTHIHLFSALIDTIRVMTESEDKTPRKPSANLRGIPVEDMAWTTQLWWGKLHDLTFSGCHFSKPVGKGTRQSKSKAENLTW